ncbi:MAG: hypothetical protein SFV52_08930 [Saprospiraceae bacterium]|nr:hypothetical protein [Saprospiraceae bacterium]
MAIKFDAKIRCFYFVRKGVLFYVFQGDDWIKSTVLRECGIPVQAVFDAGVVKGWAG